MQMTGRALLVLAVFFAIANNNFAIAFDEDINRIIRKQIDQSKHRYDGYPKNINYRYIDLYNDYMKGGIEAALAYAKRNNIRMMEGKVDITLIIDSRDYQAIFSDLEKIGVQIPSPLPEHPAGIDLISKIPIKHLCALSKNLSSRLNKLNCCAYIESTSKNDFTDSEITVNNEFYEKYRWEVEDLCGSITLPWLLEGIAYFMRTGGEDSAREFAKLAKEQIIDDNLEATIRFYPQNQQEEDLFYSILKDQNIIIMRTVRDYTVGLTALIPVGRIITVAEKKYIINIPGPPSPKALPYD